jgi:hypothetical protein
LRELGQQNRKVRFHFKYRYKFVVPVAKIIWCIFIDFHHFLAWPFSNMGMKENNCIIFAALGMDWMEWMGTDECGGVESGWTELNKLEGPN